MERNLAIIIPAYKASYLKECLDSIARQTNQNFNVYVGNDNSPENIDEIMKSYIGLAHFHYTKFESNLGSTSLLKQWERCIALAGKEEWIWLFSDDDTMSENCVEVFYKHVAQVENQNIIRFGLNLINGKNVILSKELYVPEELPREFLINRLSLKYYSAITNYIFKKSTYSKYGFKDFPLAYCSDDALMLNYAEGKKIHTLQNCEVNWRASGENISTNIFDKDVVLQKMEARRLFLHWILSGTMEFEFGRTFNDRYLAVRWFLNCLEIDGKVLTEKQKHSFLEEALFAAGISRSRFSYQTRMDKCFNKGKLLLRSIKNKVNLAVAL